MADPARARRYKGLFDNSNDAERIFRAELPKVTELANRNIQRRGGTATVNQAEVGINFITEGGFYSLADNITGNLDGFGDIGVDNYVGNRAVYRSWVPADVDKLASQVGSSGAYSNEKGESVTTLTGMDLRQALFLSGGVFAYSSWAAESKISEFATLPLEGKFFWRTVFFNAGNGSAERLYRKFGVDYYKRKWTGAANNMSARYNATWRTKSLMLLVSQLGTELNKTK